MNTVRHIRIFFILFALLLGMPGGVWAQEPSALDETDIIIEGGVRVGDTYEYTITNGSVTVKSVVGRTVTITVTPASGYCIMSSNIVVQKLLDPAVAPARGLAPAVADPLTVTGPNKSKEATDYTFVVPADYAGALVTVTFAELVEATVPVTPNTLVYTGSAQELITLGTVVGIKFDSGTMLEADAPLVGYYTKSGDVYTPCNADGQADGTTTYYKPLVTYSSTENGTYSSVIPKGTNTGNYTVYYQYIADDKHADGRGSVTVVINKAPITSVELNDYVKKYNDGNAITFSISSVKAGGLSVLSDDYVVSGDALTTQTAVGTYTCTVTATSESTKFTGSASVTFRIVEANTVFVNSSTVASDITNMADKMTANYVLTSDISASILAGLYNTSADFTGELDGNLHKITGLSGHALFNTISGDGTVKNVILEDVNITTGDPTNGDAGAICNIATGNARIYNCGILSTDVVYNDDGSVETINATSGSKVSGTRYVGGLVGLLDGSARVINCYSYASITGGTHKAGIVGYNNYASKYNNIRTMVMNCMFYGDIDYSSGSVYPIYGGEEISNESSSRLNNYNYFVYEAPFSIKNSTTTPIITKYNRALAAEERYLVRFEFYRYLLNSTRELASWYVFGSVQADAHEKMAKWVLDPSIAPYPILKPQGYYPSIVNYDPDYTYDKDRNKISRYGISERAHGKHLGTLSVTISMPNTQTGGQGKPSGASLNKTSITLNRIDKDTLNYNFNYDKVQLPYYNDVGSGNYTKNKVVTGWMIISMVGGTQGSFSTSYDAPGYNFADRTTYAKDIYDATNNPRVFSQGAYFDVPDGVTGITIEPYWGNAAYLSDEGYDAYYTNSNDTWKRYNVNSTASIFGQRYTNSTSTFNGDQPVYTSFPNALARLDDLGRTTSTTVYDYAVVLVGNYHHKGMPEENNQGNTTKKHFTVMSVDFNYDDEPDYSLIIHSGKQEQMSPIRFDFINVPGAAMAHKITSYTYMGILGNMKFNGWFETTNTTNIHFSQFEYDSEYKSLAPLILMGGIVDMFTSTNGKEGATTHTTYIHVGANVYFKLFNNGCHMDKKTTSTPHRPISVTGGDYKKFYLSGYLQPNAPAYTANNGGKNAECYISGGRFGEVAGAGYEQISGDVTWQIYYADMQSFFGGGINENKAITGDISTTIRDSYVGTFCGGPKFGNMSTDKTVTTNATGCTFDKFFGAGYGGTAITRENAYNKFGSLNYEWNGATENEDITPKFSNSGTDYSRGNYITNKGVSISYDYENFEGSNVNTVGYLFVNYASLSVARTNNVTSTLTGCTINQNFYGGGSLGAVAGDATSTLTNCIVHGNAFGAGFSASVPTASVFPAQGFKLPVPFYNSTTGVFEPGGGYPDAVPYTWSNDKGSNSNTLVDDGDNHYIHVDKATVDLSSLGTVSGLVTLNITGNTIVEGNVYGGGEESNVNGDTEVTMSGGTIGNGTSGNADHGNVFGGGKGKADNFTCDKAMVGEVNQGVTGNDESGYTLLPGGTTVNITNGTVEGSVYGGGEVGRVERNTAVTIGIAGNTTLTPVIMGSVFGAGKGKDTHGYSALVRGNSTVTVQGKTEVKGNVYGGGEKASVGRYNVRLAGDTQHTEVRIGMPYSLKAGGKCTVNIQDGATIGTEGNDKTGHVYGAGQGITPAHIYEDPPSSDYDDRMNYSKRMVNYDYNSETGEGSHQPGDEKKTWDYYVDDNGNQDTRYVWEYFTGKDDYLQFVETLARASETDVVIGGKRESSAVIPSSGASTVMGSVYGGSENGFVYYGTEVNIPNGTVKGDAFGGGKGLASYSEAGRVRRNTSLTVSGGTVEGNIYGGGSLGDVGKINKTPANYNYKWTDATNIDLEDPTTYPWNNTGVCNVTISGGTIGVDNPTNPSEHGNVFGAGQGLADNFWCEKAMAYSTNIIITDGTVKGTVYGGGEIGRVEDDTKVTIGDAEKTGAPDIKGNVFGAGKGVMTHGYSALVRGNTEVIVQGNAKVEKSIYGGGEIASVGRYTIADAAYHAANPEVLEGAPYSLNNSGSGYCTVVVKDNAEIGPDNMQMINNTTGKPDDTGHVFGAGKGVLPYRDIDGNRITGDPWRMAPGNVEQAFNATTFNETYYTELYGADYDRNKHNYEVEYFQFIETLALTTQTDVTVSGNAFIKGSIYGGSENGHVQHDTHVTIAGGQIGNANGVNRRYTDEDWASESLAECASWEYAENGKTYDPFANEYDSKGGSKTATDGHTFYGNVFGGGSGLIPYDPGKWHRGAGSVGGNTQVDITGGHILTCVYGGNEQTDVGAYILDNNGQPTIPAHDGKCTVNMTGGSVGVPRTAEERKRHPVTCNVFGAGKGDKRIFFNTWTNVINTEVNITGNARVYGSVFGGGEDGHVIENTKTNIGGTVTIGTTEYSHSNVIIGTTGTSGSDGNVFGGGRGSVTALTAGVVGGNVDLNIKGGSILGSAYGGGRLASVGTYFAMATADNYGRMQEDDPSTADVNESLLHGNIIVNLVGGTIEQNVFGGCMGSRDNVELGVSKNVTVNLNENVADDAKGCVVKGSIFGCNNLNSSPLEKVLVHVFKTQNAAASSITNPASGEQTAKVKGRYDVAAVYGGGNMAPYKPQGPGANNATYDYENTKHFAEVIIDGCDQTSIRQVYGGGNAASTPATKVTVNGTYEIDELFGGGNGKDRISYDGLNYSDNPGANVGFYDYTEVETTYNTKEERQKEAFTENYVYGTGKAEVNIFGGLVHHVFGGSNTKGNVRKTALTLLEEKTDGEDEACCPFQVDEAYGGGKSAPMDAEAKLLMACIPGLKEAYGGAQAADVQDNVTLTITNGTFDRVFGGNNISGTIRGSITVNVEETGCRPIIIGELYGGGNLAGYSVYGYKKVQEPVTENNVTTMVDFWEPLGKDQGDDLSGGRKYGEPVVNVKAFTSIGNVYGGGYGESAVMVGDPTVNINVAKGEHSSTVIGDNATTETIRTGVATATGGYPVPSHALGQIGAINNVFGGGNAAKVVGKTTVNVGTKIGDDEYMAVNVEVGKALPALSTGEKYYIRTGTAPNYNYTETDDTIAQPDTTYCKKYTFEGVDIRGNVYGGGNQAEVTEDTDVIIGKSTSN